MTDIAQRTCTTPNCNNPHQARGLCRTHYSAQYRKTQRYTYTCAQCGTEYTTGRKTQGDYSFCSRECGCKWNGESAVLVTSMAEPIEAECLNCGIVYVKNVSKYCSKKCSQESNQKHWRSQWSPIRKAFEEKDWKQLIQAVENKASISNAGCWEWNRLDKNGYPRIRIAKETFLLHRLMLEAKEGKPLGSQAAHHKCGNSSCVNPDHLQPVTHRDNVAEMLARHSYLDRIMELEKALAAVDPENEALNRISFR